MHNLRHPEHNKIKVCRNVRRGFRIFCSGNAERPVAKRHKLIVVIVLKPRQEISISLARKQDVLAIHLSNTRRRLPGYSWFIPQLFACRFEVIFYSEYLTGC